MYFLKDRSKVRRIAKPGTIGHFGHVQSGIEQQPARDLQSLANEVFLERVARRAAVYPAKMPGRDLQMTGNFLNRDRLRAKLMYQPLRLHHNLVFAAAKAFAHLLSQLGHEATKRLGHHQKILRVNDGVHCLFLGLVHPKEGKPQRAALSGKMLAAPGEQSLHLLKMTWS